MLVTGYYYVFTHESLPLARKSDFIKSINLRWKRRISARNGDYEIKKLHIIIPQSLTRKLRCQLQPTGSIFVDPITVILFWSEFDPNTVTPLSVADTKWALQCTFMVRPPITLTLVRKQYQPLGFKSSIVVPP